MVYFSFWMYNRENYIKKNRLAIPLALADG